MKYYNYNLFHTVSRSFIAQTGDPTGSRTGGESIFGVLDGESKRYFEPETIPRIKHTITGLISFVGSDENGSIGSQFFITLAPDLTYLDGKHCVFGEVVEGLDVLELLNEAICDSDNRPYQDIRITHTVILDDPFPDPKRLQVPSRSPSPSAERLQGGRIAPDEEIDETAGKSLTEINEIIADREAKARATILEMVGDIPDADMAPPENVLFVCKLNPVTTDDDLEIIFSRFGKIKSCEVIRDKKTGDSLQYAFVEFEEQKSCEDAYFKMDNVLVDDRRIHVDFSQSVAKIKWLGKGKGVRHFDDNGKKSKGGDDRSLGQGNYKDSRHKNSDNRGGKYKESSRNDRHESKDNYRDKYRDNSRDDRRRSRERSPKDRYRNREGNDRDSRYRRERSRSRDRERDRHDRRDRDRERREADLETDRRKKKYDDDYEKRERDRYYDKKRYEDVERDNKRRNKNNRDDDENSNSDDEDNDRKQRAKLKEKYNKREEERPKSKKNGDDSSSTDSEDEDDKRKKKSKSRAKKRKRKDTEESSDSSEDERSKKKRDKKKKKKKRKKRKSSSSSSDSSGSES